MQTICAWCHTTLAMAPPDGEQAEGISHGICPACAARVFNNKAMQALEVHMVETIRMLGLLLEMVGDLYEVATALAPKAGVDIAPAPSVRAWQKRRGGGDTHGEG